MHPYSIDTGERRTLFFCFAVISIILSWKIPLLLDAYKFNPSWGVEAPSAMFFYYVIYRVFDKWVWSWRFFRKIGVIKTPNLNGEWDGTIKTSFSGNSPESKATLKIFQTWTEIKIILTTSSSKSGSKTGSMILRSPEGPCLVYQYCNKPRSDAAETMETHDGTTELLFDEEIDGLSGEYYSGRGRQNFGSLSFKRKT